MPFPLDPVAAPLPLALWSDLALHTTEMLTASAEVIGHRTRRMAVAGHAPNLRDRREFSRMGMEKVEAVGESLWAMGQQIATMNLQLAVRAWQDWMAAGLAFMALASARSMPQAISGHAALARSLSTSARSASHLSDAAARIAKHGLAPIHSRATANARRLARVK